MKTTNFKAIAELAITLSHAPQCKSGAEAIRLARKLNGFPPVSQLNSEILTFLKSTKSTGADLVRLGPAVGYHSKGWRGEANLDV